LGAFILYVDIGHSNDCRNCYIIAADQQQWNVGKSIEPWRALFDRIFGGVFLV